MFFDDVAAIEYVLEMEEMKWKPTHLSFYQEMFDLSHPQKLEEKLRTLLEQEIGSPKELEEWLLEESKLFHQIQEMISGTSIQFHQDNQNEQVKNQYLFYQENIIPLLQTYKNKYNQKLMESPYRDQLDQAIYQPIIQSRLNDIQLFKEENIPLHTEESKWVNEYTEIMSNLTVEWEGEERTLSQMNEILQDDDRLVREQAWRKIWSEVGKHADQFQEMMSQLVLIRDQIATNAGQPNYRDYMFKVYERFDYTAEDCFQFHQAIKEHAVPLLATIQKQKQQQLKLEDYRPWDANALPQDQEKLSPFQSSEELLGGSMDILSQIDPEFGLVLKEMRERELLDLESRQGKSPGGFCAYLPVSRVSFIMMNATQQHHDLTTLIHEGGHAVHNHLKKEQPLASYQSVPMETAELASMSMELLSMQYWDRLYKDPKQLKQAKKEQLEHIISLFPWTMVVDRFQHWLYEHPRHSVEERNQYFMELVQEYLYPQMNIQGLEQEIEMKWFLQLHIFEVPFYYIEYAIAQLGALQLWMAYEENPDQTIKKFKEALALGSSKPLPEVYAAAGISFDFSEDTIKEAMHFIQKKWAELEE